MTDRTVGRLLMGLVLVLVGVGIAVVAYSAGYSAAPAAASAAPVAPFFGPYGFHWGIGWGFGFLFPLLFFVFIFLLIRAAFWGGRPRRYGSWYYDDPERRDAELEAWHRRAHGGSSQGPATSPDDAGRNR